MPRVLHPFFFDQLHNPPWRSKLDGRAAILHRAWLALAGRAHDVPQGVGWIEKTLGHSPRAVQRHLVERMAAPDGRSLELESRMRQAGGAWRTLRSREGTFTWDGGGRCAAWGQPSRSAR